MRTMNQTNCLKRLPQAGGELFASTHLVGGMFISYRPYTWAFMQSGEGIM